MSSEQDKAILNAIFNPLFANEESFYEEESNLTDKDDKYFGEDIKTLEKNAVLTAEEGNLDDAVHMFTHIIEKCPSRAASYNNRAQAYRMKGNTKDAFIDLNRAIELSNGLGRTACQALCQRGLIAWRNGQNEIAKSDFEAAAKLGSSFAKEQLVKLNPYAALCNQMLQVVFKNLHGQEKQIPCETNSTPQ